MKIKLSDHFNYKKLIRFTMPSIAMMIFTSIYSIVDGFFISNFAGDIPFKAINLIMPFIMIVATVGFMFGSGGTAIVANTYGAGEKDKANSYFSLFVYVTFILSFIIGVVSFIFMRPIASLLGAKGEILNDCVLYGRVLMCSLPFVALQLLFQSFCVAAEKPRFGLWVIILAGCANMILDAVLVLSLPQEHKLLGAALATATSQVLGGIVPFIYFARKNNSIYKIGKTRYDGKAILKACANGSSEFMSNVSMSLVGMAYNLQLIKYAGENGVAAYGVIMYVSMIFFSVFIGYSIGISPIVGYHNGAENHIEKKNVFNKSLIIIIICSFAMFFISELLASPLSKIFVNYNKELLNMTIHGMKIFSISYLFMGIAVFSSGFFTSLNDGITSAIISFLRTMVFQLGAVLILPRFFGLDGIWLSIVIAEFSAVLLSIIFLFAKRLKYKY